MKLILVLGDLGSGFGKSIFLYLLFCRKVLRKVDPSKGVLRIKSQLVVLIGKCLFYFLDVKKMTVIIKWD